MNTLKVIGLNGEQQDVEFKDNSNLMEVLREAGYEEIMAMCGGCCSCATCHVHIDKQAEYGLAEVEEDEEMLISMAEAYDEAKSRLSCQISLSQAQDGMIVQIVEAD